MEQPIACSLDAQGARSQLDEWRAVLRGAVISTNRESATLVRMHLRADAATVGGIVALAEREVACCPFFGFAIEIDTTGVALTATVPPDAAAVLDAFAALANG